VTEDTGVSEDAGVAMDGNPGILSGDGACACRAAGHVGTQGSRSHVALLLAASAAMIASARRKRR
jgi:hypothetical protein